MSKLTSFLRERLPVDRAKLRELTNEPVPHHLKHGWFCLGGTPAYRFVVMIVTGILLAFYYEATPTRAWESVRTISEDVAYGWFLRSIHRWAATLMVAAVVLHQMRIFFTDAYRRPRELNWLIGMGLLHCTLGAGFTGYSLVYEQLSYWGATVAANLTDNVPWIGALLRRLLLGGDEYNAHTLSRFFVLHGAILPVTMIGLIVLHVTLIRLHGIAELRFKADQNSAPRFFDFFPDHLLTELAIGLVLMLLLGVLASLFPVPIGPRVDPLLTPDVIKPEWFFYVAFRWLKLFSERAAFASLGAIVVVMAAWPFIDGFIRRRRPGSEASVFVGIVAVLAIVGLTVWEALVAH
ncbi:MAG: cytochrome bc complex cytochrome b subunit [Planctomycetes bacterium]|nr:cytochrome bc complex cytochrome b subunit [Planctomycetota bacterium]